MICHLRHDRAWEINHHRSTTQRETADALELPSPFCDWDARQIRRSPIRVATCISLSTWVWRCTGQWEEDESHSRKGTVSLAPGRRTQAGRSGAK